MPISVWADIEFMKFPCQLISLDIQNNVGAHIFNVPVTKYPIVNGQSSDTPFSDKYSSFKDRAEAYSKAVD
jgi:hypothetical protein